MNSTKACVEQLERSERGRMTIKLLRDFLKSPTVQGLDGCNSEAVTTLVARHMLGSSTDVCEVMDALSAEYRPVPRGLTHLIRAQEKDDR